VSHAAHFWVFAVVLAVFLVGMIAIVAFADHQPPQDDDKPGDTESRPDEMRLAA
jgi:hypothetical protein